MTYFVGCNYMRLFAYISWIKFVSGFPAMQQRKTLLFNCTANDDKTYEMQFRVHVMAKSICIGKLL